MIEKRLLQVVSKGLKAVTKQTEKLIKAVDKLEKAQTVKKPQAKAKTTERAPAKRAPAKSAPVKSAPVKSAPVKSAPVKSTTVKSASVKHIPAKKQATAQTDTDQIVKIIKGSKMGVDLATLRKKTGFGDTKIRNILSKACKQGKIKRSGRGIYVGA
jgi:hypothetical protein